MFDIYKDKVVLITGHTGFKGAWLCEWLLAKNAKIVGYSLEPPSKPSLYEQLNLESRIYYDYREDIRDRKKISEIIEKHQPDFVFHMAAQTLVSAGYENPIYNYETNIMGTINILESLRLSGSDCICVAITTDKVYENKEWLYSYRENDPIGGFDPYSASKGCCELLISSYARSYFNDQLSINGTGTALASARAGNVIGGGDWAKDRIIPDCMRSLAIGEAIPVRNKVSTRPWQHVLEPLSGYLSLAERMRIARDKKNIEDLSSLCGAYNFGPNISSNKTVENLVQEIFKHWDGRWIDVSDPNAKHEAGKLNLLSDKAFHMFGWRPRFRFEDTIEITVDWYKKCHELINNGVFSSDDLVLLTRSQIQAYEYALPLP